MPQGLSLRMKLWIAVFLLVQAGSFSVRADDLFKSKKTKMPHVEQDAVKPEEVRKKQLLAYQTAFRKREILRKIKLLDQSGQVFSEAWMALFGNENRAPQSVFRQLSKVMTEHLEIMKEAPEDVTVETVMIQSMMHEVQQTEVVNCPKPSTLLKITMKPLPPPDQKWIESNEADFSSHDPREGGTGNQDVVERVEIFKRVCDSGQLLPVLDWNFGSRATFPTKTSQMKVWSGNFAEGIGNGLSMIGQNVSCDYATDGKAKLTGLACKGLGQNRERMTHVLFHEFHYFAQPQTGKEMLKVLADQYQNLHERIGCDLRDPCLTLKVPMTGRILVVDNRIRQKNGNSDLNRSNAQSTTQSNAQPNSQPGAVTVQKLVPDDRQTTASQQVYQGTFNHSSPDREKIAPVFASSPHHPVGQPGGDLEHDGRDSLPQDPSQSPQATQTQKAQVQMGERSGDPAGDQTLDRADQIQHSQGHENQTEQEKNLQQGNQQVNNQSSQQINQQINQQEIIAR